MADIKWVKVATDMFDNRKIKHLRRLPDGNDYLLIWIMLLTVAGRCNAGGKIMLTEKIPYTPEMLAAELEFDEETVSGALKQFKQLNMAVTENGVLRLVGWEEHQNAEGLEKIREQNKLRKQKQRAKGASDKPFSEESEDTSRDMSRDVSRDGHVTVTLCHATEEEEGEEETEKEFHSFVRSAPTEEEIFIERKVQDAGFEGKDAEIYRAELRENIRMKYLGGELGQDIIFMSVEQFDDLCQRLSLEELEKYCAIVAECEMNGKHYKKKSHYRAILDMAAKDRRVDLPPG